MNCNTGFYKKRLFWLFIVIIVFLINQLPFLVDMRPVMYDESHYANTAYNLVHGNGFFNSIVGTRGNSNFLLPLLTAGVMGIFGCNLFSIRLTAVICGVITLVFLSLCMKQKKVGWKSQALCFLLFVSLPIFNTIFRFGRPECASLMCVAGGLWFYLRYRDEKSWSNMLGLSVFTALAGCAHPYALLIFALIGLFILIKSIKDRDIKGIVKLIPLLLAAIIAVIAITIVSNIYNIASESYITDRFSVKDVFLALPVYIRMAFFSKTTLSFLPLLAVVLVVLFTDKDNRGLALVGFVYFCVFPILFSTDLAMIGMGHDYVALIGLILSASLLERIINNNMKGLIWMFCLFCAGALSISYYFNYGVKYEKTNSVLNKELLDVVPQGSKVFGPIRQWPALMQTDYQSDHTAFPIRNINEYDFFVFNTQDTATKDSSMYAKYQKFFPIDTNMMSLVYKRNTHQYGEINIYKIGY